MARKVSDGRSIRVTVPENTTITAGEFVEIEGFFGLAIQSVTTGPSETKPLILNAEPGEYETSQTKVAERGGMTVGTDIYWDGTQFTTTSTSVYAGKITQAADQNGVVWIKFAFQPFVLDDVGAVDAKIGVLDNLDTTTKTNIVAAINEVNGNVGDLSTLDTTDKTSAVDAINELAGRVAVKVEDASGTVSDIDFNALLTALKNAGLMATE